MTPADEAPVKSRRFGLAQIVGYVLGLALFIAAVVAVSSRTDALRHAMDSARASSPWLVLAVIVLPLVNIAVISASFWVLTSRFGRVTMREMVALIISSWLLNHLPLRPGLVGRLGYHRVVNGIPIRASLRVIVEQLLCGVLALAIMLGVAVVGAGLGMPTVVGTMLCGGAAVVGVGLVLRSRAMASNKNPTVPCLVAALGFRLLDMTIWIVRYTCLFALVGHGVSVRDAAAITAASQAAMLSPIPLGLREWTVGAVHGLLGAEWISEKRVSIATFTPGVSADLANRGAELLVAVPLGVMATIWLMRRVRQASTSGRQPSHPTVRSSV